MTENNSNDYADAWKTENDENDAWGTSAGYVKKPIERVIFIKFSRIHP